MKKIIYVWFLGCVVFASCNKEQPKPLTQGEMRERVDSIVKMQIEESDERAKRDLDYRLKIDLKVKVDSILNARMNKKPSDTLKKTPLLKLK